MEWTKVEHDEDGEVASITKYTLPIGWLILFIISCLSYGLGAELQDSDTLLMQILGKILMIPVLVMLFWSLWASIKEWSIFQK